jgi:hypothetical protein
MSWRRQLEADRMDDRTEPKIGEFHRALADTCLNRKATEDPDLSGCRPTGKRRVSEQADHIF